MRFRVQPCRLDLQRGVRGRRGAEQSTGFPAGARRGDLVTSMELVDVWRVDSWLCYSCLRFSSTGVFEIACHQSLSQLCATDLGCVGDFLTVEPLWLHHRTVFFFRGLPRFGTHVHSAPHSESMFLWSRFARGTVEPFWFHPWIGVFTVCHDCGRTGAWNVF